MQPLVNKIEKDRERRKEGRKGKKKKREEKRGEKVGKKYGEKKNCFHGVFLLVEFGGKRSYK